MESVKVDRTKLFTLTEYAKRINKTVGRVSQMAKAGELKVVKINGGKLISTE